MLAFVMVFSLGSPAFAAESSSVNSVQEAGSRSKVSCSVKKIGDTSVLVESNGTSELVTVVENGSAKTVTIQNTKTGEKNYLRYDKLTNTIYSSFTGQTVHLNNSKNSGGISTNSETSYSTEYISYTEIRDTIGTTATVRGLVGLIVARIPGAQLAGGVIGTISTIVGGTTLFIPNDSNHGLRLTVQTVKYYRTRVGMRYVYRIDHSVTAVTTY